MLEITVHEDAVIITQKVEGEAQTVSVTDSDAALLRDVFARFVIEQQVRSMILPVTTWLAEIEETLRTSGHPCEGCGG